MLNGFMILDALHVNDDENVSLTVEKFNMPTACPGCGTIGDYTFFELAPPASNGVGIRVCDVCLSVAKAELRRV